MSAYLPEETIARVREATDIVDIIGEHIELKRAGTSLKARCPFHPEKTPSFMVNPQRQIYKCFGCGKAGNVFNFLMEIAGLSFPETVRQLATRNGIVIEDAPVDTEKEHERHDIFTLLEWTTAFYQKQLQQQRQSVYHYLEQRQINTDTIAKFRIGFAPNSWDDLLRAATTHGFSLELLHKAGLIVQSRKQQNQYYDYFRNRLMFPIWDSQERIIAFGARTLNPKATPKYLNSPETPFFSKSKTLYAFSFARPKIMASKKVLVVEGYTDALMAHQHGFTQTVATLGTALTEEHVKFLRRYSEAVTLVFDGDAAGIKAAERSVRFFLRQGLMLRVAVLPDELDPCDFLIQNGRERFAEIIDHAEDFLDFQIKRIGQKYDLSDTGCQRYAIDELAITIKQVPDLLTRRLLVNKVSTMFQLPPQLLLTRLGFNRRPAPIAPPVLQNCRQRFLCEDEKFLLWAAMHYPDYSEKIFQQHPAKNFSEELSALATAIQEYWCQHQQINVADLSVRLNSEFAEKLINLYYTHQGDVEVQQEQDRIEERLNFIFKGIQRQAYKARLTKLKKIMASSHKDDECLKMQLLHDAHALCKTQQKK